MPQISADAFGFTWFNTIGGPLILSPIACLPHWKGIDDPRHDWACSEDRPWIEQIPTTPADPSFFLSLWIEPSSACWQPDTVTGNGRLGLLWRWVQGKKTYKISEAVLPETATKFGTIDSLSHPSLEYLLFDAVDCGTDGLETGVRMHLTSPLKSIQSFEYKPDAVTQFIIHEFWG